MTNATLRTEHIQDSQNIYEDIKANDLPAVSIVKPGWPSDGHPASSKLQIFEGFVKNIVTAVQAQSGSLGQHRDLYHFRRRRRLL